jgi:hypothetical protein
VAFVAGSGAAATLLLARVERPASGGRVVADPRAVVPGVRGVTAVAFDGPAQLTYAVRGSPRAQLYRVDLDGYNLVRQRDEGLPSAVVDALAASTASPPDRVASAAGRLWRRAPGADWVALAGRGSAAAYAG